jgi:hypothetical protein
MKTRWQGLEAMVLAVGVCVAGCQGGNERPEPKTYPVRGKVVYKDGTPVTPGRVEVQTTEDVYHTTIGLLESNGSFSLYTLSNNKRYEGAQAGTHQAFVTVVDPRSNEEIRVPAGKCTVQPSNDNDITLRIDKPRR